MIPRGILVLVKTLHIILYIYIYFLTRSRLRLAEHSTIICKGKIQYWLLHKEYSSTIAERLLTTPCRKTEQFLRKVRWKAYFFLNPDTNTHCKDTYSFKSTKNPPPIDESKEFEDDMLKMMQSTKFTQVNNPFLNRLKDTKPIKNETKLLIAADKTMNFYILKPSTYNDPLEQKPSIQETKTKLGIDDRADTTANRDAFITLKDHEPNFANIPTCQLINPTKSEIGRISKAILEKIYKKITRPSKFNRWRKKLDPNAQTANLTKEGRHSIWRHNEQLRRCWNMRVSRKFPPFPTAKPQHQHRTYDGLAISNATPKYKKNINMPHL